MSTGRAPVSVVVPFAGDRAAAERLRLALSGLRLCDGDEVIVGDNSNGGVAAAALDGSATVVRADRERSSYHARNAGAGRARHEWILFIDADCVPVPGLIDGYFKTPVDDGCGALAGPILPDAGQRSLAARYARARGFVTIPEQPGAIPTAPTGNLLVRCRVFDSIGGFAEGIRSGGDVDLCRRLQAAGWSLELRPEAAVTHPHNERLLPYLRTVARYAAGARWLNERYPGIAPPWPLWPQLALSARDAAVRWARGDLDEAAFRLIDGLSLVAHNVGYRSTNRA